MKIIKYILKQHCRDEDDHRINFAEEIFYTIKAIVCYLLRFEKKFDYNNEYILVCSFNFRQGFNGEFTTEDWTELHIGKGVNNWFFSIATNGNP